MRASAAVRTDDSLSIAGEIAALLDGIPLALELAAPRIAALGARTVRDLLLGHADVLTRGAADGPKRHATMRAAIDWSWQLLDSEERDALARASVFRGGFTLAALAACLSPSPGPACLAATTDVLHRLIEKSMVRAIHDAPGEQARFDLYAVIREYAAEQLAATGEAAATEARHAKWYVTTAERDFDGCYRAGGLAALSRLRDEQDNLNAVVERGLRGAAVDLSLATRALLAVHPVVVHYGGLASQLARWDMVLGCRSPDLDPATRARALAARGRLLQRAGPGAAARDHQQRAAELAGETTQTAVEGQAL
jgi:predicted ATPase